MATLPDYVPSTRFDTSGSGALSDWAQQEPIVGTGEPDVCRDPPIIPEIKKKGQLDPLSY